MNKTVSDVLIGDLLRGAGLVTLPDLTNAIQVASKTGLPVGRVLVMLGLVTSEVVQAALHAQSLVREHLITFDTGKKALCVVSANRISFEQALESMGANSGPKESDSKLGDLLEGANLITHEQLVDALNTSQHLGLPLGRILVLKGMLGDKQVESALDAQVLLRDGRISRPEALEALRTMKLLGATMHESLGQLGCQQAMERNKVRLGELVMLAGLVLESDLLTALEIGLVEGVQLGRVLIEFGFITDELLQSALKLQTMVGNEHLTIEQAGLALKLLSQDNLSLVQAVSEVMEPIAIPADEVLSLLDMLQLAALINQDDYKRLLMFKDTSIFEVVLVETGLMSETTLYIAMHCNMLVKEGLLTMEQAIVVLHHWRWTGISLKDVLETMGWTDGQEPELVPGIYHWQSHPNEEQLLSTAGVLACVTSLANAENSINSSLTNFEWGTPQVH